MLIESLLVVNLTAIMVASALGFVFGIKELKRIHAMLNSRFTELLTMAQTIAHAAGVNEERERHIER